MTYKIYKTYKTYKTKKGLRNPQSLEMILINPSISL